MYISVIFHFFQDQVKFSWTNDSLPTQVCPRASILAMFNQMKSNDMVAPGLRHKTAAFIKIVIFKRGHINKQSL